MSPELVAICQQLIKAGKTVSVGMVKARAPKNTPLPAIVQAVQYCKSQASTVLEMDVPEVADNAEENALHEKEIIANMAKKIAELDQRILELERKL